MKKWRMLLVAATLLMVFAPAAFAQGATGGGESHGALWIAAAFGLVFSITAHAGDLFESFVKRHFGVKNPDL